MCELCALCVCANDNSCECSAQSHELGFRNPSPKHPTPFFNLTKTNFNCKIVLKTKNQYLIGSKHVSCSKTLIYQFQVETLTFNLIRQLNNQETTKNHARINVQDQLFILINIFYYHNKYRPIQIT